MSFLGLLSFGFKGHSKLRCSYLFLFKCHPPGIVKEALMVGCCILGGNYASHSLAEAFFSLRLQRRGHFRNNQAAVRDDL